MPESGMTFFSPASNDGVFTQLITSPFYPSFKRSDQGELKVSFNNGYVFDYSNADKLIEPISISSETEYTLSETDDSYFLVELTISKLTGEVKKGEIVKRSDKPEADDNVEKTLPISSTSQLDYNHLGSIDVHDSQFEPSSSNLRNLEGPIYFKWLIRLADFKGESTSELYLRDNLHINFTKLRQCGSKTDSSEVPLIALDGSLQPQNPQGHNLNEGNGVISLYGLKPKVDEYNIIELTVNPIDGIIEIHANTQALSTRIDDLETEP